MTLHEQKIVNSVSISDLLTNISARVFSMQEEIRRLKKQQVIWHDLRKNPKDLPPVHGISDCTIDVLTDGGNIAYFDYNENCWCDSGAHEIDTPIAWCEIPEFKEEKV